MDIGSDCCIVGVVVVLVMAVSRVASLIRGNLFTCMFGGGFCGLCSICGGICCLCNGSGSDGRSDYAGSWFFHHHYYHYRNITATTTITTSFIKTFTTLHMALMVSVVIVAFFGF